MALKIYILLKTIEINIFLFLFQSEEFKTLIDFIEIKILFIVFLNIRFLIPEEFHLSIHLLGCLFSLY